MVATLATSLSAQTFKTACYDITVMPWSNHGLPATMQAFSPKGNLMDGAQITISSAKSASCSSTEYVRIRFHYRTSTGILRFYEDTAQPGPESIKIALIGKGWKIEDFDVISIPKIDVEITE